MDAKFRPIVGGGVDALCDVVGRHRVVRAARFLLRRSCRDVPNNPHHNGEYALQRWLLAAVPPGPVTALDVGAHAGNWSTTLLALAQETGHQLELHAFEPASYTHRQLTTRMPDTVRLNQLAVSDRSGEATLQVVAPGAGRNSLHRQPGTAQSEQIQTTTVDEYMTRVGVDRVHLLKIDTEGHDFRVLAGAERAFARQAVSVAQFEYNHRWVHSRHYLKDVFDLLQPLGYQVGKLTRRGVEWYPGWDPDLETLVEGNYVAATDESVRNLPGVRWWKEGRMSCMSA